MAQTVECLLCNHEALSSNPTTIKKKRRKEGREERERREGKERKARGAVEGTGAKRYKESEDQVVRPQFPVPPDPDLPGP
jgi:hypothetical protein